MGQTLHDDVAGDIAPLAGDIFHLWHGSTDGRRTLERYVGLNALGFDPADDLEIAGSGVWRWRSEKPALHDYVRSYFVSRAEDGEKRNTELRCS